MSPRPPALDQRGRGLLLPALALVAASAIATSVAAAASDDDPARPAPTDSASIPAGGGSASYAPDDRTPHDRIDFAALSHRPAATVARHTPQLVLARISVRGIPRAAYDAYVRAAASLQHSSPGCGLTWSVLAAVGLVESDHAASGGSSRPGWNGIAHPPILGPVLDGHGFAAIRDTDHGRLDGDPKWDRAVGPMQFLPSTWARYGAKAGGPGRGDPQNINDAALAAARYLCTASSVRTPAGLVAAVFAYNHSVDYVRLVLQVVGRYQQLGTAAAAIDLLPPPKPAAEPPARTPTRAAATPRPKVAGSASGSATPPVAAGAPPVTTEGYAPPADYPTAPDSPTATEPAVPPVSPTPAPSLSDSPSPASSDPTPSDPPSAAPTG